jgi:uncharacterized membrane protein YgcG
MPVRYLTAVGLVLITLGSARQVSAECWLTGIVKGIVRDVTSRQIWPEPYKPVDKAAALAPYPIMVENGWRRQNMLVTSHFDATTKQLTEAGQNKVRWILTAAPQQHRSVYVHVADSNEETSARIASVQQFARKISPNDLPPILTTTISEDGWAADEIDMIGRKYLEAMPAPKLPASAGGGGSSGGSSGGGGGGGGGSN